MYKLAGFFCFKNGMASDEGRRYWRDVHGPLTAEVATVSTYVQNHALRAPPGFDRPRHLQPFDGYACQWFTDQATCERTVASSEWQTVVNDGNVFQEPQWTTTAAVEETVHLDGPRTAYKLALVAGTDSASAGNRADEGEALERQLASTPFQVARFVTNAVIRDTLNHSPGYPGFEIVVECWFDDEDAFLHSIRQSAWTALINSCTDNRPIIWQSVVQEYVIKDTTT